MARPAHRHLAPPELRRSWAQFILYGDATGGVPIEDLRNNQHDCSKVSATFGVTEMIYTAKLFGQDTCPISVWLGPTKIAAMCDLHRSYPQLQ